MAHRRHWARLPPSLNVLRIDDQDDARNGHREAGRACTRREQGAAAPAFPSCPDGAAVALVPFLDLLAARCVIVRALVHEPLSSLSATQQFHRVGTWDLHSCSLTNVAHLSRLDAAAVVEHKLALRRESCLSPRPSGLGACGWRLKLRVLVSAAGYMRAPEHAAPQGSKDGRLPSAPTPGFRGCGRASQKSWVPLLRDPELLEAQTYQPFRDLDPAQRKYL